MKIRKMQNKDIESVYQLGVGEKSFEVSEDMKFWTKDQIKKWITSKNDVLLVAEEKGDIIGFIMSAVHVPTQKATIENIYVAKEHQGKGVAKKMLDENMKALKDKKITFINSFVEDDNKASFNFFKKNSFNIFAKFYWFYKD